MIPWGILFCNYSAFTSETVNINITLPSPAVVGNGARLKLSYTQYNGNTTINVKSKTPFGLLYTASDGIKASNTYGITIGATEFICDGTNWYEVPSL